MNAPVKEKHQNGKGLGGRGEVALDCILLKIDFLIFFSWFDKMIYDK